MIHYELRCPEQHGFDGWFPNGAAFDEQAGAGQVCCPVCGSCEVQRALMAPSVSKTREVAVAKAPKPPPSPPALPDQARVLLQKIRTVIEANCENVGDRFPEEVRSMHYGDAEQRGVYGRSTPDEAKALAEEGIEVAVIPWVPLLDS
jgi:hypothetical protein